MAKVVIKSRGSEGPGAENIAFSSEKLRIDMVTSARLDGQGRWLGRPEHHRFSLSHQQSLSAEHWLFRAAVASFKWKNQGATPPEATFEMYKHVGGDEEPAPIMTISTKGLLVSHWSMSWSEGQQTIAEHLELKAWQILSMHSEVHDKVVQSFLAKVGPNKEPK